MFTDPVKINIRVNLIKHTASPEMTQNVIITLSSYMLSLEDAQWDVISWSMIVR